MKRSVFLGASFAVLVACSSTNPFITNANGGGGGTGGTPTTTTNRLPESVRGDAHRISYSPGAGTITVEGITLDNTTVSSIYTRNAGLDRPGYQAYATQDDALDRQSVAYVMQSGNSGSVRAGVVVTGGQFNRVFAGNYAERDGGFTPPPTTPTTGLVSYAGNYVGMTNGGPDLPAPPGTPAEVNPNAPNVVTGQIFINADFADNSVNGAIYDRTLETPGGTALIPIPSVVLIATSIADDGTFDGTVEYSLVQGNAAVLGDFSDAVGTSIGSYGGVFGGPQAEAVGGAVVLTEWDGPQDPRGIEGELEWGVFVLDQCGTPGANAAICADVNPDAGTP